MSSDGGFSMVGNFSRSSRTVSIVSSTLSVVCDSQTRLSGSGTVSAATSSGPLTRIVRSGAWPIVPSTSSWPACPIRMMVRSALANRVASRWTFVTRGQVASMACRSRSAAPATTAGETPCALKTTCEPARAPRPRRRRRPHRAARASTRRARCGRSACGRRRARRTAPGPSRPRRPRGPPRRSSHGAPRAAPSWRRRPVRPAVVPRPRGHTRRGERDRVAVGDRHVPDDR